ncbi:hypothetical protein ACSW9V_15385 (plasmid) [Clostridium perfringens]|uniref:hypothetical protein n=1 Tax=Clostridium perfringens TaxID=1502 RepID=UPI000B374ACE|nr:hypothetical protein [Clostridium perfringens]EGT0690995.1 hypothetical protein [Clostridium perfringens]EGT0694129.1 hypothetical protein [Clostridium perfringens]EGT0696438.1 hypothetical protein [Clostridium perfringens]MDU3376267.1 hypothetical protein [Clostridium perfringens]MDU3534223.1 hypothetical protein [Clostridium perfringens]
MVVDIQLDTNANIAKVIKTSNGKKKAIDVSVEDLISSIKATSNKKTNNSFKTIINPLHQKEDGFELIQSIQTGKNDFIYIFKVDKKNVPFYIYDKFFGLCGMPRMLIAIRLVNSVFNAMYVNVIKDSKVTLDTQMYEYPFSNVNSYNGHVCFGRNIFKQKFETVESMFRIINYFFEIPNTMETFNILNNSGAFQFRELAELLADTEFDDGLLVPKKCAVNTYSKWIEKFTRL